MPKAPPELVERFEAAVSRLSGAQSRKMFGYPAAFMNGNLFTGLFTDRWFVRPPEEARAELTALGGTAFEAMPGRPMREYVELPPDLLTDETARADWLDRSLSYAASLPPKAKK